MLPPDVLACLVRDFYDLVLSIDDHHRLLEGPVDEERHGLNMAYFDGLLDEHRHALARNHFDGAGLTATVAMRRSGIDPNALGPGELNQIRQAILRAGIDVAKALRARNDGDFTYEPRDKLLQAPIHQPFGTGATAHAPAPPTQPSAATATSGPPLSEVGVVFRESQVATGAWDQQTAQQASSTFRLFIEVCGDKPLSAYMRREAGLFRDQIARLPRCTVPRCGGMAGHHAARDALWARFFTAAPARQRRSVARSSYVKRA